MLRRKLDRLLEVLAPYLVGELSLLQQALQAAQQISNENSRIKVLRALLDAACQIADQGAHANALEALAPYLIRELSLLKQALQAALQISSEHPAVRALKALLDATQQIADRNSRTNVLKALLDAACQIANQNAHANALEMLSPYLVGELPLLQQALQAAQQISSENFLRIKVLRALLDAACQIADQGAHANTLEALAPYLIRELPLLERALQAALQIPNEYSRARVLGTLLETAQQIAPKYPVGPSRYLERVETAQQIAREYLHASVLKVLVPHLVGEPSLFQQALAAIHRIADEDKRAEIIVSISETLKTEVSYDLWAKLMEILLSLKRPKLLEVIPSLVPIIEQLGGRQAIKQTAQAIIDVSKWWP